MVKLLPRPQSFAQLISQNVYAIVKGLSGRLRNTCSNTVQKFKIHTVQQLKSLLLDYENELDTNIHVLLICYKVKRIMRIPIILSFL